ncbi:MAG: HAD-IIIA family hydrolase [Armatimonadetes bacterium]|nr:HAD-IIIA family hydrolase [Armatimonadota bacterium]
MLNALEGKPRIKLLACDVDGVLTDGGMYFGVEGQVMKRFNVKDGMGMALLRDSGVKLAFISADPSEICRVRGEKLHVHDICFGVTDKAEALQELMARDGLTADEVVYVGDDLPDLCLAPLVGLFVAPADAVDEIKAVAGYVTRQPGGHGAIREVCDAIRKHNEAVGAPASSRQCR